MKGSRGRLPMANPELRRPAHLGCAGHQPAQDPGKPDHLVDEAGLHQVLPARAAGQLDGLNSLRY